MTTRNHESSVPPAPDLSGRVAVVTGGSSGIGRATAMLLARHGAQVYVGDRQPLEANSSLFAALHIEQRPCDVRNESAVQSLIAEASAGGTLSILVNNAGVGMAKPADQISEDDWDLCLDTNLKGTFFASKHAIQAMRRSGGGSIVNVSSNAAILPHSSAPVYSISKAAVVALTRTLALCYACDRIRVNAVCPGPVGGTRMMEQAISQASDPQHQREAVIAASPLAYALNRLIGPDEIAQSVLYLVSDAALMITGTVIAIDGGKSCGVPPV